MTLQICLVHYICISTNKYWFLKSPMKHQTYIWYHCGSHHPRVHDKIKAMTTVLKGFDLWHKSTPVY